MQKFQKITVFNLIELTHNRTLENTKRLTNPLLPTLNTVLLLLLLVFLVKFKPTLLIVLGVFFCTILVFSVYSSSFNFSLFPEILAQSDLHTTKYRNMVIGLGNGLETNARLNLPSNGDGPFPGVLLYMGLDR